VNRAFVISQLEALGVYDRSPEILQDKAGITVLRVRTRSGTAVAKCFEDDPSRREITNYRLLQKLGVPTLRILACTDAALLMEDMVSGGSFRPACEEDMADAHVAAKLALWYRMLHDAGFSYVAENGKGMYSETDLFSRESIDIVKQRSGTEGLPLWQMLEENFDIIRQAIDDAPMTLTYNDFYYTNMAVARDGSSAIMFDYNLLGKGHVYSDMRNVLWSLSTEAGKAFAEAYGAYDTRRELLIDGAVSTIITLCLAYRRDVFPGWAEDALKHLKNGYADDIERLLTMM